MSDMPSYSSPPKPASAGNSWGTAQDPPGSSGGDDRSGQTSLFQKIWKSFCCAPAAPRRMPRSLLKRGDNTDDPDAEGAGMDPPLRAETEDGTVDGRDHYLTAQDEDALPSPHQKMSSTRFSFNGVAVRLPMPFPVLLAWTYFIWTRSLQSHFPFLGKVGYEIQDFSWRTASIQRSFWMTKSENGRPSITRTSTPLSATPSSATCPMSSLGGRRMGIFVTISFAEGNPCRSQKRSRR